MDALKVLEEAKETAQTELAQAEVAYIEASARVESARTAHSRLESAVAALSGEPPPAVKSQDMYIDDNGVCTPKEVISAENTPKEEVITPKPGREDTANMTPEEFNAARKQKQREKRKAEDAWRKENDPLYNFKCTGCGEKGKMQQTMKQTGGGGALNMLICGGCGNQQIT